MTYQLESNPINKAVSVRSYRKKIGGFPNGANLKHYDTVAHWSGAMRKKHGETMPVESHMRGDPKPTKPELAQKKMNNALAAQGSSKRVYVNEKGKAKIVSKDGRDKLMAKRKWGKQNLKAKRAPKAFGELRNKG